MTTQDDLDPVIGDWLAEGPSRTPEPILAAAVQHARSHPRRPDPLAPLRRDPMGSRGAIFGFAPLPVVVGLGLVLLMALGVAIVGAPRDAEPAPVPTLAPTPTIAPTVGPSMDAAATPMRSPLAFPIRVGLRTAASASMTVDVTDRTGTLVDARTAPPVAGGSQPEGIAAVENIDEQTLMLTWTGAACDIAYTLTITSDAAMTMGMPPCIGDTLAIDRRLLLQFDGPIDGSAVDVTVIHVP